MTNIVSGTKGFVALPLMGYRNCRICKAMTLGAYRAALRGSGAANEEARDDG